LVCLQHGFAKKALKSRSEDFALFSFGLISGILLLPMFLCGTQRKKYDTVQRYFSVGEESPLTGSTTAADQGLPDHVKIGRRPSSLW
jgi:hypothetical protein